MNSLVLKCEKLKSGQLIELNGSKSISNRALIIKNLCRSDFRILNLSKCDDTEVLQRMLSMKSGELLDAGHAGTSFRFMTAFLAIQPGTQILTGSDRMKKRPIGPLVNALIQLGCQIEYIEKEGYPPLRIQSYNKSKYRRDIKISGSTSSQYLSALLMIACRLPQGLILEIQGELVSRPYLEMTLSIMQYFGVSHEWLDDNRIQVLHQDYLAKDFEVEADWSAASYFYPLVAASNNFSLDLKGLKLDSLQGDRNIVEIGNKFAVSSKMDENGLLRLHKNIQPSDKHLELNLLKTPDLAQTIAVMSGMLGYECLLSGLQTLKIKETDRIVALKNELAKVNVSFAKLPGRFSKKSSNDYFLISGKAIPNGIPFINTYEDHRMAMAFAALSLLFPIEIENPVVVNKSYPNFWIDLERIGIQRIN